MLYLLDRNAGWRITDWNQIYLNIDLSQTKTFIMNNTKKIKNNSYRNRLILMSFFFLITLISNPLNAQEKNITVKGIVKSDVEPLDGVSIYLKGSTTGTISKANGSFTFPSKLKAGDVLVFSYLGFTKQSIVITKESTNLDVVMVESPVEILSALNSNKPLVRLLASNGRFFNDAPKLYF